MKCFPLMPCYGGTITQAGESLDGDLVLTYESSSGYSRKVRVDLPPAHETPKVGDIVVIHGPTVSWMTPDEFAEHYEEIPNVAAQ